MLHQALLSLIIQKGYDEITVEDICERANVGKDSGASRGENAGVCFPRCLTS
jgi:hypothetical protein